MVFTVQFSNNYPNSIRNIQTLTTNYRGQAQRILAEEVVRSLKSSRSLWPVATGLSKRSFYTRVRGKEILLNNRTDYARFVEHARNSPHRGKARRTIERDQSIINRRVNRRLEANLNAGQAGLFGTALGAIGLNAALVGLGRNTVARHNEFVGVQRRTQSVVERTANAARFGLPSPTARVTKLATRAPVNRAAVSLLYVTGGEPRGRINRAGRRNLRRRGLL